MSKMAFLETPSLQKKIDFTQNSLGKPEEKWKISYHLSSLCEINLQSTSWVLKLILWNQYLWKLKFWPYLTAKIWDLISFRLTKWAKKHIFWFWTSWFSKIEGLCIGSVGPCILSARSMRALIHLAFYSSSSSFLVGPFPQFCSIRYFYMSVSVSMCP